MSQEQKSELNYRWSFWAREAQLPPQGQNWSTWIILAGRGFGKTRTGAEHMRYLVEQCNYSRLCFIGPTAADVRDVMIEGESGLLKISPPWFQPKYEPSRRRVVWPNGATAITFSAEEPDRLRGPQHQAGWADEFCSWRYPQETWDMYQMGLRSGGHPHTVMTTTPKKIPALRRMLKESTTRVTSGSTYENAANLSPMFLKSIVQRYEGTELGRQELHAELLEDREGALWTRASMIDDHRVTNPPDCYKIVVAVDPPAGADEDAAECGIVVVGIAGDGHGYVLDDLSMQGLPNAWAAQAVAAYHKYRADRIIGEVNNGGAMVESTIRTVDPGVPFTAVHATRGKYLRAEPVSSLYEQGRIHHVGFFSRLEDQQCNWVPGETSPDRLDALVWGVTYLMLPNDSFFLPVPVIFLAGKAH